jgi:hypothetical protein
MQQQPKTLAPQPAPQQLKPLEPQRQQLKPPTAQTEQLASQQQLSSQTAANTLFERQQQWLKEKQVAVMSNLVNDHPQFMTSDEFERFTQAYNEADSNGTGKISGQMARSIFLMSLLSNDKLMRVWKLCDLDRDGQLTRREFLLGCWLIVWMLRKGRDFPPRTLTRNQLEWTRYAPSTTSTQQPTVTPRGTRSNSTAATGAAATPPPTSLGKPKQQQQQPTQPNAIDLFQYSQSEQGKEFTQSATSFSQTPAGQKIGSAAWENRDQIYAASQTPAGKQATAAVWDSRDQFAKAGTAGMKSASTPAK